MSVIYVTCRVKSIVEIFLIVHYWSTQGLPHSFLMSLHVFNGSSGNKCRTNLFVSVVQTNISETCYLELVQLHFRWMWFLCCALQKSSWRNNIGSWSGIKASECYVHFLLSYKTSWVNCKTFKSKGAKDSFHKSKELTQWFLSNFLPSSLYQTFLMLI